MDSLKTLIDKGQYQLVVDLTQNDDDPSHLFYRCSAFLALSKVKEALDVLLSNRQRMEAVNPALTLKSDFELRFLLKDFDGAYEDLEYFKNRPYVSQEVEEYLAALPGIIRTNERNAALAVSRTPEEIRRLLKESKDDYEVLSLLNYIQGPSVSYYFDLLKDILVSDRHPSVKTYALLLLVSRGYDQEVTFNKNGQVYKVVPKNLKPPYVGEPFDSFTRNMEDLARDPSVYQAALTLLNDYVMDVYPEEVIKGPEDYLLMTALLGLALTYLHSSLGIEGYLSRFNLSKEAVEALEKKIEETLKASPALSI
jgi:hypothetical protein